MDTLPDPTYWHEIIAAASALIGAIIGGGITFFLQRAQHKHENTVRFHEPRLDAYEKFALAASLMIAGVQAWAQMKPPQSLSDYVIKFTEPFNVAYTRVCLVGNWLVAKSAEKLLEELTKFTTDPAPANLDAARREALRLQAEFAAAVRMELGVETVVESPKYRWVNGSLTMW
jgi:hypothetical protein